jgi:hypothetical protein
LLRYVQELQHWRAFHRVPVRRIVLLRAALNDVLGEPNLRPSIRTWCAPCAACHRDRIYDHPCVDGLHPPYVALQSEELLDDHHHGLADHDPLSACQKTGDHDLHSDDHGPLLNDHDLHSADHDLHSADRDPRLDDHDLLLVDQMTDDHDWMNAHRNFLGAMVDRYLLLGVTDDRYLLLGVTDDHLRYEDEVPRHPHDVGVLDDHQTCVGGQRHQLMDDLGGLQTCVGELLGPPQSADAMGAHHLDEDVKDGCRPGVVLL